VFEGAISGMITGLVFTASYIIYLKFINPSANSAENWWFGISPEGIGTLGMLFNFIVSNLVSQNTAPPPKEIQSLVDKIRVPRGAGASYHHIKS
jgi:cation/acetate symporter